MGAGLVTAVVLMVLVTEVSVPPEKSVSATNGLSAGPPQLISSTSVPPLLVELLELEELELDELLLLELELDDELLELDELELELLELPAGCWISMPLICPLFTT